MTESELLETFKKDMQSELNKNSHKGSILNFKDFNAIITEFEYHKAKLFLAIRTDNKGAIREYLADCGNYLVTIGNYCKVYDKEYDENFAYELNKEVELIKKVDIKNQSRDQKIIKNEII